MKPKQLLAAMFMFLFAFTGAYAQNISGTINIYTNVTAIVGANVTVGNTAGFSPCDRVMIIQMKGATINTANNASFGQVTAIANAGNYEFANIASIAGNVITLTNPLTQAYTLTGSVQLVRVPVYTNPTITATLTCTPWNGTTGGVLVFESSGPVTMNANIDASGTGFRGGVMVSGGFGCGNTNYATGVHGKKGEGVAAAPAGLDAHRAPLANGGGGSSPGNSGGGGGGNYAAGGRGGNEYSGCGATGVFGMGGYSLTPATTKAFAGGGGGGGFRDNGQQCANGSNGGGIVMINAPSIAGNGFSILATGVNVTTITSDEGAGAGGAGGSVYLRVPVVTSPLTINVKGGNGGNIQNGIFTGDAHGPGGGGGGGYVWVNSAAMPANLTVIATGGSAGLIQHAGAYFNTTFGAAAGSAGATLYNLPSIPLVSNTSYPPVNIGPDTIVCGGGTLLVQPDTIYPSYQWSTAQVTQSIVVNTTGTYWLEVPIGCGLFSRDSILVTISNPQVNLGNDTSFCVGDSVQFNAGVGFASYAWNTGASTSSIYSSSAGTFMVQVTDATGCTDADTVDVVNVFVNPVINLGNDTTFCGTSLLLDAGPGYNGYLWQNNSTNSTYTANNTGNYFVTVTDINGCNGTDSIQVTIHPVPNPNLGPDVSFCAGDSVVLNPGNFAGYAWNTGAITPTLTATTAGTYIVGVVNVQGCTDADTMQVLNVYPLPVVNLGPNQSICQGTGIVLSTPGNLASYQWSNGTSNATLPVSSGGLYWLNATDVNGCSDADSVTVTVLPLPQFTLGNDGNVCPGESYEIIPTGPSVPVSYLWSDNTTTGTLTVFNIGTYYLTVTDANTCQYTDTIEVLINCPPTIYIPNAFTPNLDDINTFFRAYGTNIKDFRMEIYNRWGQPIYTITDMTGYWDGKLNGEDAPMGVYVYRVYYNSFLTNDEKNIYGSFSLLR